MQALIHRKAVLKDLREIIDLLIDDDLGQTREKKSETVDQRYIDAFHRIDSDENQYLMVVTMNDAIVATCHLTLMSSLTFLGSIRMQIEGVRVATQYRGQKIGEWMMKAAFDFAKDNQVSILQLSTNKERIQAKKFYERLGFKATHEGMKCYL